MKRQIYFSFITAAISFITLRTIQDEGVERHLHTFPTAYNESVCFIDKSTTSVLLPFDLSHLNQLQTTPDGHLSGSTASTIINQLKENKSFQTYNLPEIEVIDCFTQSSEETFVIANQILHVYEKETDSLELSNAFKLDETIYKIAWNENTSRLFALHHDPELIESLIRISTLTLDGEFVNAENEWVFSKSDILNKLHDYHLKDQELQHVMNALNLNFETTGLLSSKKTGDLFVVMSDNRLLLRISGKGRLVAIHYLDPHQFIHPIQLINDNSDEFMVLDQLDSGEKYLKAISLNQKN